MKDVPYTGLRQKPAHCIDAVIEGRVPLLVTPQGGKGTVVILSEEEFAGWQETVHLLRSSANAERLLRSVRSADAGKAGERDLAPSGTLPAKE